MASPLSHPEGRSYTQCALARSGWFTALPHLLVISLLVAAASSSAQNASPSTDPASARMRISVTIPASLQVSGLSELIAIEGESDISVTVLDAFNGVVDNQGDPPKGMAGIGADGGVVIRESLCIRGDTNNGYYLRAITDPGNTRQFELRNELNESLPFDVFYTSQVNVPGEQLEPERRSTLHYANRDNPQCEQGDNALFEFLFSNDDLASLRAGAYTGIVRFTVIGQ